MEIQERKSADVILVDISGRIDSFTAEKLEEDLSAMINAGKQKFIINFEKTNYISSAGLKVFLAAYKKLSPNNGKIKFVNMPDSVLKVFAIAGFDKFFEIYPTENEALEDFKGTTSEESYEQKRKARKRL